VNWPMFAAVALGIDVHQFIEIDVTWTDIFVHVSVNRAPVHIALCRFEMDTGVRGPTVVAAKHVKSHTVLLGTSLPDEANAFGFRGGFETHQVDIMGC